LIPLSKIKICLITPPFIGHPETFYSKVEEALSFGIRSIQFRNKVLSKREALKISLKLREITRLYEALYLVNDEIDLALASDADGVHIGQEDFPLEWARKLLGRDRIIGISTHDLREALEAEEGGADYVGFGSIFPTSTKEKTVEVGLEGLRKVSRRISIPVLAIGGISQENFSAVFKNGAAGAALISAVWSQDSVKEAVGRLLKEAREASSSG
jgi:thiamine-phosphate pyrophosphorylase